MSKDKYLGDASKADWVMDGTALQYQDSVLLTMAPDSVGTVLASSTYMWYGNAKATFKSSRGQGVVTAFILLSDVKDEIDYEFVGADLLTAQTNYYFQGITDYDNGGNITVSSDTFENWHTYEIDWTPDQITWSVDGVVGRTKKKSDTWNATSNQWDFPQTPARVQLSIWPGGLASNSPGTIAWAGGAINWDSTDIQSVGYDYAMFQSVEVQCYNASSAPGTNTGKSYTYNDAAGTNNTVIDGDKDTILSSFLATGTNMTIEDPSTATASGSSSSSTANTIPGGSNVGSGDNNHASGAASASSSSSTGSSGSSSSSNGGWSQGDSSSSTTKSDAAAVSVKNGLGSSAFAVVVGVLGLMVL